METNTIFEDHGWRYISTFLPEDIEESSVRLGALVRRRNIPDAETLLRIIIAYAISDMSLKDVSAWASSMDLSQLRGPSLHHRLTKAAPWLEDVLRQVIQPSLPEISKDFTFKAVDATVICGPGATGTEWRLHVVSNPKRGCLCSFELTDRFVGERLDLHTFNEGDVALGDRVYSTANGIYAVRQSKAHVIVRTNPHTLRVCDMDGKIIKLKDFNKKVPDIGVLNLNLLIPIPPIRKTKSHRTWPLKTARDMIPARVIGSKTKRGEVIWVLTTLEEEALSAVDVLRAYRFRWQIELLFKRLKSLLNLDSIPIKEKGPTAKAWILARLLAAALVHKLVDGEQAFSPWGYELRSQRL